jgi:hypothetical protein
MRPASISWRMIFKTSSRSARRYARMHLSHATLVGSVRRYNSVATADLDSIHCSDERRRAGRRAAPRGLRSGVLPLGNGPAGSLPFAQCNVKATELPRDGGDAARLTSSVNGAQDWIALPALH